ALRDAARNPHRRARRARRVLEVAGGGRGRAGLVEQRDGARKVTGKPFVVRVEEGDYLAASFGDAPVARRARPRVRLSHETQARVFVRLDLIRAAVGRAVVNDYKLEVAERLRGD